MSRTVRVSRQGLLEPIRRPCDPGVTVQVQGAAAACGNCSGPCRPVPQALHLREQDLRGVSLDPRMLTASDVLKVRISILQRGLTDAALVLYGLPVALLLLGSLLGDRLAAGPGSVILGFAGLALACAVVVAAAPRFPNWLQVRLEPEALTDPRDCPHDAFGRRKGSMTRDTVN